MNAIITSEQFAREFIRVVQKQGCCYDLLPEAVGNKIKVSYIVDGDRIGWYESSRTFFVPDLLDGQDKHRFVVDIVRDMNWLLIGQKTGLKESYWELKRKGKVNYGKSKSNVDF
jgi:hypothetical protein